MTPCIGPHDEPRAATHPKRAPTLCASHYQQQRRHPGRPLEPLQAGPGERVNTAQVVFRCTPELKRAIERAAKRGDVDPAEWIRRALAQLFAWTETNAWPPERPNKSASESKRGKP